MSFLEGKLLALLAEPGIPAHLRQRPFEFRAIRMITDAYIPAWRLIVEADGRRWHQRKADMERDRIRDNAAVANGYAVLRFTWRMLTADWDQCLRDLRQTGAVRTAG
jgi:very-short-patch-repair endonuclease